MNHLMMMWGRGTLQVLLQIGQQVAFVVLAAWSVPQRVSLRWVHLQTSASDQTAVRVNSAYLQLVRFARFDQRIDQFSRVHEVDCERAE